MPMSMAPLILYMSSDAVRMIPMQQSRAEPDVRLPKVIKVALSATMSPAFFNPNEAMNTPMPTEMDAFNCRGMALTIFSRTLVILKMMKMMPSNRMAVKANCHE